MTKCMCNNIEVGSYDNQVMLDRPPHMAFRTEGSSNNMICVDTCLKDEILYLWSIGISTTGCCCGHNKISGYIGVINEDIEKMKSLGYKVHHNKCRPMDEDSFDPKSIREADKIEKEYQEFGG